MAALLNPLYGGKNRIVKSGLMTEQQYSHALEDLYCQIQLMQERESGHIVPIVLSSSDDTSDDDMDDPVVRSLSTERQQAVDEYGKFQNICKLKRYLPASYSGDVLKLGPCDMKRPISLGRVGTKGPDVVGHPPFVTCNFADFIGDDGRFDLVRFFKLQQASFPFLYKLSVCLASIRTNEVGCERFFSTAGYVSCPRRTSLNVRNYECLATLRANMQNVYIDEE